MASLSDIFRALGFGTVSGLGSAEEQRQRADRQAQLELQRKRLEQETMTHQLEWGMASPEELSFYGPLFKELGVALPQTGQVRRRDIPNVLHYATQAAGRPKDVDITDLAGLAGVPFQPRVTATPGSQPGTFGEPAESGPSVTTGPPPPRMLRPDMAGKVLDIRGQSWRDRLAQKKEQHARDQEAVDSLAQDLYDQKRTAGMGHGAAASQAIQEAQARFPNVSVMKYPKRIQPAQPVEAAVGGLFEKNPYTEKYGPAEGFPGQTATAADREAVRKDREARDKLTAESTRLQNEIRQARLDQINADKQAGTVLDRMKANQAVSEKEKSAAATNSEHAAQNYEKLAQDTSDIITQQAYMNQALRLRKQAADIREYQPGRVAAPTGKMTTADEYIKKLEGR